MTKIKKIVALMMVIALAVSIFAVGTVAASAADKDVKAVAAGESESGVTIHYKSENGDVPYIYYWNSLPKNIEVDYPGVAVQREKTGTQQNLLTLQRLMYCLPTKTANKPVRNLRELPANGGSTRTDGIVQILISTPTLCQMLI